MRRRVKREATSSRDDAAAEVLRHAAVRTEWTEYPEHLRAAAERLCAAGKILVCQHFDEGLRTTYYYEEA